MEYKSLLEQMGVTVIEVVQNYKPTFLFYFISLVCTLFLIYLICFFGSMLMKKYRYVGFFASICFLVGVLATYNIVETKVSSSLNSISIFNREDYQTYVVKTPTDNQILFELLDNFAIIDTKENGTILEVQLKELKKSKP